MQNKILNIYFIISFALVVASYVMIKITQFYLGTFAAMPEWERPIATVIFINAGIATIIFVIKIIMILKED